MVIEIEKKYSFTLEDYEVIKSNCENLGQTEIKDYYLDTNDYSLIKKDYYLRMRNGIYELKIGKQIKETSLVVSKEITDEEEIEDTLKKDFNISIDDTTGVLLVETFREKYSYEMNGENIIIDIDTYQYGKRYEIEVVTENKTENEVNDLIEKFREKIGLKSNDNLNTGSKIFITAQHQNIDIFEILNNKYN